MAQLDEYNVKRVLTITRLKEYIIKPISIKIHLDEHI